MDLTQSQANPARVLFAANTASLGGASQSLLALLRGLPREAIEPVVVLPAPGPLADELRGMGVRAVQCEHPWWVTPGGVDAWLYAMRQLPEAVRRLREWVRAEAVRLVWTNTSVTPAPALAAALEDVPHVWRIREYVGQGGFRGPLEADAVRRAIVALSWRVAPISHALASEFEPGAPDRVWTAHVGIDTSRFADLRPAVDGGVIAAIGTTTPEKGLDDLVEAAGLLAQRGVAFQVRVVGEMYDDQCAARVRRRLSDLALDGRFAFDGFRRDVREALAGVSVSCCASHTEGMSRAVVEAMAAGVPVVSTDCGGPRDLVEPGVTGLLVPVQCPAALADALEQVLRDPRRAARMGEAGRQRAQELFDVRRTVPREVALLEEALRDGRPAREAAPLCELMLALLEQAGPRVLLGKKWRLMRRFLK